MANLKLIKDLASIKGLTIEQLAEKAQITTQSIHLMGRSGKTKMETLEKIAEILEVPPYVFYDDKFDVKLFQEYVVRGHHNPTSFFGPIYNGGEPPFTGEEGATTKNDMENKTTKENRDLIRAKDETIGVLQKQVEDLLEDKNLMRKEICALKEELAKLKSERSMAQELELQVNQQV